MKTKTELVRFWNPRRGGWRYGERLGMEIDDEGNGIVEIKCLGGARAIVKIKAENVEEVNDAHP